MSIKNAVNGTETAEELKGIICECDSKVLVLSDELEKARMALRELLNGYEWDYEPSASKALEWGGTIPSYQKDDEDAKHSWEYLYDYRKIMWLIHVAFDYCYSAINMAEDIEKYCSDAITRNVVKGGATA